MPRHVAEARRGDGSTTPAGYYRLGASAPRDRIRQYAGRRRRVTTWPEAGGGPQPLPTTEYPNPVEMPLVVTAASPQTVLGVGAVATPLAVPAPSAGVTPTPDPVTMPLAVPTPAVATTEKPAAVTVPLVVPEVTTSTSGVETPDPVTMPLAVPTPAVAVTEKPAAVTVPLVVPQADAFVGLTETPDPVTMPLAVPTPAVATTETPAAVTIPLAVPTPSTSGGTDQVVSPDPVGLSLVTVGPAVQTVIADPGEPPAVVLAMAQPTARVSRPVSAVGLALAVVSPGSAMRPQPAPLTVDLDAVTPATAIGGVEQSPVALVLDAPAAGLANTTAAPVPSVQLVTAGPTRKARQAPNALRVILAAPAAGHLVARGDVTSEAIDLAVPAPGIRLGSGGGIEPAPVTLDLVAVPADTVCLHGPPPQLLDLVIPAIVPQAGVSPGALAVAIGAVDGAAAVTSRPPPLVVPIVVLKVKRYIPPSVKGPGRLVYRHPQRTTFRVPGGE